MILSKSQQQQQYHHHHHPSDRSLFNIGSTTTTTTTSSSTTGSRFHNPNIRNNRFLNKAPHGITMHSTLWNSDTAAATAAISNTSQQRAMAAIVSTAATKAAAVNAGTTATTTTTTTSSSIIGTITKFLPSTKTILICVLLSLLIREWWSKTPVWIQKLIQRPFQRNIVAPIRSIRRRFFGKWLSVSSVSTTPSLSNSSTVSDNNRTNTNMDNQERMDVVHEKDSFFTDSSDHEDDDTIVGKLSSIMTLAQSTTETVRFEGWQLQGALLVALQMVQDSRRKTAEIWDQYYESSGKSLFVRTRDHHQGTNKNNNDDSTAMETEVVLNVDDPSLANTDDLAIEDSVESRKELLEKWIDLLHLADWAYLEETNEIRSNLQELQTNNTDYQWSLIRHVKTDEPGRVGHYMAIDSKSKTALIAVKGTSKISDVITDACGVPVRYNVTDIDEDGNQSTTTSTISCHEGVLDASLALLEDVQPLVEHLFVPAGYRILLVGHSLGAGVACIVGKLLRSRIPALRHEKNLLSQMLPLQRTSLPLEVVAFAPPPILDLGAAVATSLYTTSIVNNDDMIPRASLSNLVSLLRFLKIVDERLAERGMRLEGPMGAFDLLKKVLRKKDGDNDTVDEDDEAIMTPQEIFDGLNEAGLGEAEDYRSEALLDFDHLFVPGKVVVVYEKHVKASEESLPTDNAEILSSSEGEDGTGANMDNVGSLLLNMLSKQPINVKESESEAAAAPLPAGAIVGDGAAFVLRHININQRMVGDHMPVEYEKTLRALM